MKLVKISLSIAALALLSACATTVKPTYASPTFYQTLGWSQLQGEYNRIQQYIDNGVEPPKRTGVGVGVGLGGGCGSRGGWGIGPRVSVNMAQSADTKRAEQAGLLVEQAEIGQATRHKICAITARHATPIYSIQFKTTTSWPLVGMFYCFKPKKCDVNYEKPHSKLTSLYG